MREAARLHERRYTLCGVGLRRPDNLRRYDTGRRRERLVAHQRNLLVLRGVEVRRRGAETRQDAGEGQREGGRGGRVPRGGRSAASLLVNPKIHHVLYGLEEGSQAIHGQIVGEGLVGAELLLHLLIDALNAERSRRGLVDDLYR